MSVRSVVLPDTDRPAHDDEFARHHFERVVEEDLRLGIAGAEVVVHSANAEVPVPRAGGRRAKNPPCSGGGGQERRVSIRFSIPISTFILLPAGRGLGVGQNTSAGSTFFTLLTASIPDATHITTVSTRTSAKRSSVNSNCNPVMSVSARGKSRTSPPCPE